MKPTGPTSKGLNRGRFVASSRRHATAHYLGHLGLPSYPRPAVGPKFKRGAKFVLSPNFKQVRPICSKKPKTSASQTETWFSLSAPRPLVRFPIHTPWAPKLPLHQPQNPGVLRPPSATPSHPSTAALLHHAGDDTPTSSCTTTSTATPSTASS